MATTIPLPISLAGAKVRDESGNKRIALLFLVSLWQINNQVPNGTLSGQAFFTVTASDGGSITGVIQIISAAPTFFTLNSSGTGPTASR